MKNMVMNTNNSEPIIVAFCCHYCAYAAADLAGSGRLQYPPNIRIIRSPCTGRLEVDFFMKAFESGVDGVLVAGCEEGSCHFQEGNLSGQAPGEYRQTALAGSRPRTGATAHGQCQRGQFARSLPKMSAIWWKPCASSVPPAIRELSPQNKQEQYNDSCRKKNHSRTCRDIKTA